MSLLDSLTDAQIDDLRSYICDAVGTFDGLAKHAKKQVRDEPEATREAKHYSEQSARGRKLMALIEGNDGH